MFPDCDFRFHVEGGAVPLGARVRGAVELSAKRDIPRAEVVLITYAATASVSYGNSQQRSSMRLELCKLELRAPLPPSGLAAGAHRFPFDFAPPPGLPPSFNGSGTRVEHRIEARVDVDWALDPVDFVVLDVRMVPTTGARKPVRFVTPPSFHPDIALEVALASSVIVVGEPIRGHFVVRGDLTRLREVILTGHRAAGLPADPLRELRYTREIPASEVRAGAVGFEIPPDERFTPSFSCEQFGTWLEVHVKPVFPLAIDTPVIVPVVALPVGSRIV
ncbi:MAG: hypothetical protein U0414_11990 [Polyangiaceae bacterium]